VTVTLPVSVPVGLAAGVYTNQASVLNQPAATAEVAVTVMSLPETIFLPIVLK
jgi:hypothetical protein